MLFETDNIAALIQRAITRSSYDHIGIVVKFNECDLRIFDCNPDTGVSLDDWDNFIWENDLYSKY